jgi:hypothetical protein
MIDELVALRNKLKSDLGDLDNLICSKLTTWQSKASYGFVVNAVYQYRKEHPNASFKEAKDAVDFFRNT